MNLRVLSHVTTSMMGAFAIGIHLFCCVLPALLALAGLVGSFGMFLPFVDGLHDVIHDYEIPLLLVAGLVLAVGWGLEYVSFRIDCRKDGTCTHAPCTKTKKLTFRIQMIATILYLGNCAVFFYSH